jgi:hypothetical protein
MSLTESPSLQQQLDAVGRRGELPPAAQAVMAAGARAAFGLAVAGVTAAPNERTDPVAVLSALRALA